MDDLTAEFFDSLGHRGYEPLLGEVAGTVRFDLNDGRRTDYWLVDVKHGDVRVMNENRPAECVVMVDRGLFDRIVSGRVNAMAALLRGALLVEGSPDIIVSFQRLFGAQERTPV